MKLELKRKDVEYMSAIMAGLSLLNGFIGAQIGAEIAVNNMDKFSPARVKGHALVVIRDLVTQHMNQSASSLVNTDGKSLGIQNLRIDKLLNTLFRPSNRDHFKTCMAEFKSALNNWIEIIDELVEVVDQINKEENKT